MWSARSMGASRLRMLWDVVVPSATPELLNGIRTALALSFILMIGTLLVAEGGVDPATLVPVRHYDGTPITARFITKEIAAGMSAPRSAPINEAAK